MIVKLQKNQQGFTLIELVIIIVLLGILAVSAGSRLFSQPSVDLRALSFEIQSVLRYTQQLAMQDTVNDTYRVRVDTSGGTYQFVGEKDVGGEGTQLVAVPLGEVELKVDGEPIESTQLRWNSKGCLQECTGLTAIELSIGLSADSTSEFVFVCAQGFIRRQQCDL